MGLVVQETEGAPEEEEGSDPPVGVDEGAEPIGGYMSSPLLHLYEISRLCKDVGWCLTSMPLEGNRRPHISAWVYRQALGKENRRRNKYTMLY